MLHIFRKYERILFLIITVVIVISFSFFGTYSSMGQESYADEVAFVTVNGSAVTKREFENLALFIGTDQGDKQNLGGAWGPNFLNNGVIKEDLLKSGLAQILIHEYEDLIRHDLAKRLDKEKRFTAYAHPQAPFLSAKNTWNYFAPEMNKNLDVLSAAEDPLHPEALEARVTLFLAQEAFPSTSLRQILLYQANQYQWLSPDPILERGDLSLFGYHFVEDWFGPQFSRLVAGFLCNAEAVAKQRGYVISDDEVLADLLQNAQKSFDRYQGSPALGVNSVQAYFSEQLRRMGISQGDAIRSWKKVLLFRRLFSDLGGAALVDNLVYQQFLDKGQEYIEGEQYSLAPEMQFSHFGALQEFEVYLSKVSDPKEVKKGELDLPTQFRSVSEVLKTTPELVVKNYRLHVAHVRKKNLEATVPLKDVWDWQTTDQNWLKLTKKYPSLAMQKSETREERFAALDDLDAASRKLIDQMARASIVEVHPEWTTEAMDQAISKEIPFTILLKGEVPYFIGVNDSKAFLTLLDEKDELPLYTGDGENFYHIQVLDRDQEQRVLTFSEAIEFGVLRNVVEEELKNHYSMIRSRNPSKFQGASGEWREFHEVSNLVAEDYFSKVLGAILNDTKAYDVDGVSKETATPDVLAPFRFYSHIRKGKQEVEKEPSSFKWVRQEGDRFEDQFKLVKNTTRIERGDIAMDQIDGESLFDLPVQKWSGIALSFDGNLHFTQIQDRGIDQYQPLMSEKMKKARELLSFDAGHVLMQSIAREMKVKRAFPNIEVKGDEKEEATFSFEG